jgi:lipopolysaccharide/colanic/teichoic acid biosynthesis glycosyltransferase
MATITGGLPKLVLPGAVSAADSPSFYERWGKRLFDVSASFAGLVLTSPLLIFCALLVRLTSRGPVLFRQTRIGRGGCPFTLNKFRTMFDGAETLGPSVVVMGDQRLTPVGSFLRQSKLDELPQFINVLRGDMSFVGPRPRVPEEIEPGESRERVLQQVRPGITSYASIHHRMEADYCSRQSNPQSVHRVDLLPQKLSLDCEYVQNLGFRLDLKLLLLTVVLVCVPGKLNLFGQEVRPYTRRAQMLLDLVVYMGTAWLAYTVRYEAGFLDFYRRQMWLYIAFIPALRVLVNRFLGVYDMMWRYVTLEDASHLAAALGPITVALYALRLGLPPSSWQAVLLLVPLSITTLEYLLALSAGLGLRSIRRMLYMLHHHYQPLPEGARRVLILGAGLLGLMTAQDIRQYPHLSFVGFVDDDPEKHRRLLGGRRVLGTSADLEDLCARHRVTDMMICAKWIHPHRRVELDRRCEALGIKIHAVPCLDRLLRGESDLTVQAHLPAAFAGHQR